MTEHEVKVIKAVQYIRYILPVIIMATGLPLAFKMIGPNNIYGVRTAKAYESTEAWYAVNSLSGWVMVGSAVISFAVLIWMQRRWNIGPIVKLFAMTLVPTFIVLLGVLGVVVMG